MSLIQLVKKAVNKPNATYIQDLTRVVNTDGYLEIWRADRLMLSIHLPAKRVAAFDVVGASETRAANAILLELHIPDANFMYSRKEVLLLTPRRVDNKVTWEEYNARL